MGKLRADAYSGMLATHLLPAHGAGVAQIHDGVGAGGGLLDCVGVYGGGV